MVKIRLRRMGAHKKPFYRIVVADSRAPRNGRFIEEIGYYNPISEPKVVQVNEEKALKWMLVGAQTSETVKSLFRKNGILEKFEAAKAEKQDNQSELVPFWCFGKDQSIKIETLVGGTNMGELVAFIAKSLVDHPEQVEVSETYGQQSIIVELRVAPEDMGKVIGKQGRIAKAIRTVVRAVAIKENKKVIVEIID